MELAATMELASFPVILHSYQIHPSSLNLFLLTESSHDEMVAHPMISEDINNATDDCRHAYINDLANRMWNFYLLEFPPGVTLSSSSVFKDAGDNEELDYELVNYEWTESNTTGGTRANRELWVHFTVARTDLCAAKRGKVEESKKKSKAASKLAKLGSAMSN